MLKDIAEKPHPCISCMIMVTRDLNALFIFYYFVEIYIDLGLLVYKRLQF